MPSVENRGEGCCSPILNAAAERGCSILFFVLGRCEESCPILFRRFRRRRVGVRNLLLGSEIGCWGRESIVETRNSLLRREVYCRDSKFTIGVRNLLLRFEILC